MVDLENGIKKIKKSGIDIILVGFFQQNPQWDYETNRAQNCKLTRVYNNKLIAIAKRNGIYFADIYNQFERFAIKSKYSDLMADYIHHPTDFGHKLYYLITVPLLLFNNAKESELLEFIF